MKSLAQQINESLDVYEQRGEYTGSVKSAYHCLRRARFVWSPEIRAVVEDRIRKPTTTEAALRALAERLGMPIAHGARHQGKVSVDDFDVQISIAVSRRVPGDESRFFHDEAYRLITGPEAYRRCQHTSQNRSPYRMSKTKLCTGAIAGAIVYKRTPYLPFGQYGPLGPSWGYDFVCPSHRDHHGYAAIDVITIVRFSESERSAIRRARTKRQEEWYAKQRAEEERGE